MNTQQSGLGFETWLLVLEQYAAETIYRDYMDFAFGPKHPPDELNAWIHSERIRRYVREAGEDSWRDYYDYGSEPEEAFDEDRSYWDD